MGSKLLGAIDFQSTVAIDFQSTVAIDFQSAVAIATKSILFIDPTVEDYQILVHGTNPDLEVVVLDTYRDGIQQITETLVRNQGIKAVHIVSHGTSGRLYLGNSTLDLETIEDYTKQLQQWGEVLDNNADILIYGCNVAADLVFVQKLRELTGANIAASATPTGSAALGGDWELEVTTGEIEASLAFSNEILKEWKHILAAFEEQPYFYQVIAGQLRIFNPLTNNYEDLGPQYAPGYNATGYNVQDNLIYGVEGGSTSPTGDVVRINSDGTVEKLLIGGSVVTVSGSTSLTAGGVDDQGNLWVRTGNQQLTRINLTTGVQTPFNLTGPNLNTVADIIYNKSDGNFYGAGSGGFIYTIDIDLINENGSVTRNTATGLPNSQYGAAWIDVSGDLYLSRNNSVGGLYRVENFTTASPTAVLVANSQATTLNDGVSDPRQKSPFDVPFINPDDDPNTDAFTNEETFTEGDTGVGIVDENVDIKDFDGATVDADGNPVDGGNIQSATITLTNPQTDDEFFEASALPSSITASISGNVVTLTAVDNTNGATPDDFEEALKAIQFRNTSDTPNITPREVDIQLTDTEGNAGNTATTTINVIPVNDPPEFQNLDNTPTFTIGGDSVILDGDATITDPELDERDNYNGATLTLARDGGADSDDQFSSGDTGVLGDLTEGDSLIVNGTTIGTVTINSGGTLQLIFDNNATGALVDLALQNIAYTKTPAFRGPEPDSVTIKYTIDDGNTEDNDPDTDDPDQGSGGPLMSMGTIVVDISENQPPVANNSAITVDEASQDTGLGLTAPTDADGDPLTITVTGLPTLGQVTKVDGTAVNNGDPLTSEELQGLLYDAPADYNGTDDPGDFTYNVSDGTTTVSGSTDITITTVNDAPTLDLDGNDSSGPTGNDYTTTFIEGGSGVAIGDNGDVVITDVDDTNIESATITLTNRLDGDTVESLSVNNALPAGITASSYDQATGKITLTGSATLADYQTAIAQITYNNTSTNPNTNARSVTVVVNDGDSDSNTATTTINIIATNSAPVVNSSAITVDEASQDTGLGLTAPTDADGDPLTITVTGLPTLGQVTKVDGTALNNGDPLTSEELQGLLYDAPADYNGTDDPGDFTYNVGDGTTTVSGSTDITINVAPVPELNDDTASTPPNTPVTFNISDNDENVDIATIDLDIDTPGIQKTITVPGEGTFTVDDDGNVTYTPEAGFEGEASIPYAADDTSGNPLEPADISVNINNQEENTTLNPGDIAFVQYNADGTDNFKFVALGDIPASEEIKFTDKGWLGDNSGFSTGEGIITWTAPAGGISAGTVVEIDNTPSASVGTVSESGSLNFAATGDQIIAYQGTNTAIAALNNEGSATWQADATNTNTSALPQGLTNGTNAVAISEIDNAIYTGITTGDQATLLAAINDSANWSGSDSENQTFTATFTIDDGSDSTPPTVEYQLEVAQSIGGSGTDRGHGIATDSNGNVWATGEFQGSIDIDSDGNSDLTSNGEEDGYIAKFDTSGNLLFAQNIGSSGSDHGFAIATDSNSNVWVTGEFQQSIDIDSDGNNDLTSNGYSDSYVAKFDSNGNLLFAQNIGGSSNEGGYGIATDSNGNVWATGFFYGSIDIDSDGNNDLTGNGSFDSYIAKFDSNGNFQFAQNIGSSNLDRGRDIATDSDGNVWATGDFEGSIDIDSDGNNDLIGNGSWESYVAKFDSDGNLLFAQNIGGSSLDQGYGIATDSNGNVWTTGYFQESIDINGDGNNDLTSSGSYDSYIAKFDSDGNLLFAQNIGGSSTDQGYGIVTDSDDNVWATGYFRGSIDIDGDGNNDLSSQNGSSDSYVAKFDSNGNLLFAQNISGSSTNIGFDIATDSNGNVWATGDFTDSIDIDGNGNNDLTSNGNWDSYVVKFSSENATPNVDTTPPTVTTLTPSDNAMGVAIGANLEIKFDEDVLKGTNGDIVIKQASNDQVVETISVSSAQVEVNTNTVTIDPSSNLDPLTEYYVEVSSGAFKDTSENNYQGISDKTTWNFTTTGETIAIRRGNQILIDDNSDGTTDRTLLYGSGSGEDQYLVGDWDGDNTDEIAVRRGNAIDFDDDSDGTTDRTLLYGSGAGEDQYLVGDWDGDNTDEIAVRRGKVIHLDDDSDGTTDRYLFYGTGAGEDQYLVGDWDGDNTDEIAVRRGKVIHLDDDSDGKTDRYLFYGTGVGEDQYLAGDWDNDGIDEIALRRGNRFLMNYDTDGRSDRNLVYGLGNAEDEYLIGVFSDSMV